MKCTMITQTPGIIIVLSWAGLTVNCCANHTTYILLAIKRNFTRGQCDDTRPSRHANICRSLLQCSLVQPIWVTANAFRAIHLLLRSLLNAHRRSGGPTKLGGHICLQLLRSLQQCTPSHRRSSQFKATAYAPRLCLKIDHKSDHYLERANMPSCEAQAGSLT